MTVAEQQTAPGPIDAPIPAPPIVRQRRIRPGLLGLAVLLVALGGLGSAWAVTTVRATGDYLAVARAVPVGSPITDADLATVQLAGGQGLQPVPAADRAKVVGRYAAVPLVAGSLLTAAQLTDKPLLEPGKQQVSLGLKPSQVPAEELHPGDAVLLVGTPGANAARDGGAPPAATKFEGVVVGTLTPQDGDLGDDTIVVYVAVPERDAPTVVTLAGQDRIGLVLKPGS